MKRWLPIVTLAGLLGASMGAGALERLILDHLYLKDDNSPLHAMVDSNTNAEAEALSKRQAEVMAADINQSLIAGLGEDAYFAATQLANVGILQTYTDDLSRGQANLEAALEQLQSQSTQHDPRLTGVISALGINAYLQSDYEGAEAYFRRSQHIHHRDAGLYSSTQTSNLNWLTRTYLADQRFDAADIAQRYVLDIARRSLQASSPQLNEVKAGIAVYLGRRGSTISPMADEMARANRQRLFSDALLLIDEVIESIERTLGENVLDLIPVLKTKAQIHYWRGGHSRFQNESLERTLTIIQSQEAPSAALLKATWLDLADSYVLTGSRDSMHAYRMAWNIEPEHTNDLPHPTASDSPSPDGALLEPVLLKPKAFFPVPTDYRPKSDEDEAADTPEPLYVDFDFTISEYGKPRRLKITDRNVPTDEARLARNLLASSRYRPALENGQAKPFPTHFRVLFVSLAVGGDENPVSAADSTSDDLLVDDPLATGSPRTTGDDALDPEPIVDTLDALNTDEHINHENGVIVPGPSKANAPL